VHASTVLGEVHGTPEQFEALRRAAQAHSPNAMSLATGVAIDGTVKVS